MQKSSHCHSLFQTSVNVTHVQIDAFPFPVWRVRCGEGFVKVWMIDQGETDMPATADRQNGELSCSEK